MDEVEEFVELHRFFETVRTLKLEGVDVLLFRTREGTVEDWREEMNKCVVALKTRLDWKGVVIVPPGGVDIEDLDEGEARKLYEHLRKRFETGVRCARCGEPGTLGSTCDACGREV